MSNVKEAHTLLGTFVRVSWVNEESKLEAAIELANLHERRMDRRARLFSVIGSWLVLIALAMFCTCCGRSSGSTLPETHASAPRTLEQAAESAVRVERACVDGDAFSGARTLNVQMGIGSGVVIATGSVITVAHVVECDGVALIHVVTASGTKYPATVLVIDKSRDYARLRVPGLHAVSSAVFAKASVGDDVCTFTAWPYVGKSCGKITKIEWQRVENGIVDLWSTARTVPGNSGSGMYNARGELVGLASNKLPCITDAWRDDCGGLATSLFGRVR